MQTGSQFSQLLEIMAKLRDPKTGCPWDVEQDFRSIRNYTIEEAYEVWDAIERADFDDLCAELGDLLLQPVFLAQMASEKNLFDMDDVIAGIVEKLIRRHPHIFDRENLLSSAGVLDQWEDIKAREREEKAQKRQNAHPSLLDDIALAMPALARGEKLAKRAAKVGFDWPNAMGALEKCREELDEIEVEITANNSEKTKEEIGDLLFAVANLARKAGIAPEVAMSNANAKFTRRFKYVEKRCRQEKVAPEAAGLDRLQQYWDEIRASDISKL